MNKIKKYIIPILIVLGILLIIILVMFMNKTTPQENNYSKPENNYSKEENKENGTIQYSLSNVERKKRESIKINKNDSESTKNAKIKKAKDNKENDEYFSVVEVSNIEIIKNSEELEIKTILKNNSDEDISGFFITMGLYNKDGKEITQYSFNTQDKIPANGTYTFSNYAPHPENEDVVDAKVLSIEKNI